MDRNSGYLCSEDIWSSMTLSLYDQFKQGSVWHFVIASLCHSHVFPMELKWKSGLTQCFLYFVLDWSEQHIKVCSEWYLPKLFNVTPRSEYVSKCWELLGQSVSYYCIKLVSFPFSLNLHKNKIFHCVTTYIMVDDHWTSKLRDDNRSLSCSPWHRAVL